MPPRLTPAQKRARTAELKAELDGLTKPTTRKRTRTPAAPAEADAPAKQKRRKSRAKSDPHAADSGEDQESQAVEVVDIPGIDWKEDTYLTDTLLTKIENNEPRRVALGFAKGDGDNAGKVVGEKKSYHYERLAEGVLVNIFSRSS
ncbi:hypothetical protein GGX14DRAFT_575293 [Mycena pura]|uniref:Uncharacterized protein n=1 Tax=Mycena pura TaxID=153505 RepID=A0AAD6UV82_9AGAR|nr:hypothetical protein GGX14DRAFT_575293 [Mycena pura]